MVFKSPFTPAEPGPIMSENKTGFMQTSKENKRKMRGDEDLFKSP